MGATNFDHVVANEATVNGQALSALVDEVAALSGLDAGELGVLNGVTPGTVTLSKAVIVDANRDITGFRNVTATGAIASATLSTTGAAALGNSADDTFKVHGAATSGAQSALVADTAVTGAAMTVTSAQISGGESPTEAEHNAVQADIVALRADSADIYTTITAMNTLLLAVKACLVNHGLMAAA